MKIDSSDFNSLFGEALNRGGEALEKVGEVTGLYIQDKLRENSFARKILPPQTVTLAELTRNENDEGLSYIDDIEPDSLAMRVNWRGEPEKTYIEGKRYSIRMSTISSDRFVKSEQELRSYRMPLTKIIEQNTVKDMQEQHDKTFMDHVRVGLMLATRRRMNDLVDRGLVLNANQGLSALSGTTSKNWGTMQQFAAYLYFRNVTTSYGLTDYQTWDSTPPTANLVTALYSNILLSTETEFTRTVLRDAIKIQAAREMKARCFLLHEYDWADVLGWMENEAGLQITGEIVKDGYKYTTVGGYTFVTTVRDNPDIVQPGQIFTFPAPEFLGRYLILENTKFWIEKKGRFIEMEAYEDAGMGFGNIKGLGLILLNGASVVLPNLWQDSSGATVTNGTVGYFRLTNVGTTVTSTSPVATA
jgi:hypothetical protein